MQQEIFSILPNKDLNKNDGLKVSFGPFIKFIEEKLHTDSSVRTKFYNYILTHFNEHLELLHDTDIHKLKDYPDSLQLLYACLFPLISNEQEALWSLSVPNEDAFFYSTPAFFNSMAAISPGNMYASATEDEIKQFENSLEQAKYTLILERIYKIEPVLQEEIVYKWTNKETGLPKYYSIQIDNRFAEVVTKEHTVATSPESVAKQVKLAKSINELECTIPLTSYHFEGFSIITATDITARYALHKMRSTMIGAAHGSYEETYKKIIFLLQALCGTQHVKFGLLPFLKLNGKLVSMYRSYKFSVLINIAQQENIKEEEFLKWINNYYKHPGIKLYRDCNNMEDDETAPFCDALLKHHVKSYALIPVYHHNEPAGLLEVSATKDNIINQKILKRLDAANTILSQLMFNTQNEFKLSIDEIVKLNFTSVQPAVQWKFNEVALEYLKSHAKDDGTPFLKTIHFQEVFPVYGAVDIRNSTVERNNALYKDTQVYFSTVQKLLEQIKLKDEDSVKQLQDEAGKLQEQEGNFFSGNDEAIINKFIEKVNDFLKPFAEKYPEYKEALNEYFTSIEPEGAIFEHRRALEASVHKINRAVSDELSLMQEEIKNIYPVFFEKFRSDGVEYDMYVGQAISPTHEFKETFLEKLRRLQIVNMANIARKMHALIPHMPVQLQTTQLIYVNAHPIDISFRADEKRFDVEGGYNIRYHIVKKRIDKVHIKNTNERLTQPGTIAIVYSDKEHESTYLDYVKDLQQQNILTSQIEVLELEELQGVTGLKAIRVTVVI